MSIEARACGTHVIRLVLAGTALALLSPISIAQVADEGSDPSYESRFICEEVPGGTVCTRANFHQRPSYMLFNQVRSEVARLLSDAATCMDEKPHLACGRRYLDSVLSLADLNNREAAMALTLDARYWISQGNEREAIRSYEMILELPEDHVPSFARDARRMLDKLSPEADPSAAGVGTVAE